MSAVRPLRLISDSGGRTAAAWGILIAVFGMRIVFPLLIVVIAAGIGPWQALLLAASQPEEYARIMQEAHLPIAAFGGTFLMMVGLSFFFDHEKDVHWVGWIERHMAKYAAIRGVEVAVVLLFVLGFSHLLEGAERGLLRRGHLGADDLSSSRGPGWAFGQYAGNATQYGKRWAGRVPLSWSAPFRLDSFRLRF